MPITSQVADTLTMDENIELAVEDRILEYIKNYTSDIPLSKEWVKKKGNNQFFLYSGSTYSTVFSFNGTKWNDFELFDGDLDDMSQGFKYSSYQKTKEGIRSFLPNGEPSFDDNGDPTDDFCEWVSDIILEVLEDFI